MPVFDMFTPTVETGKLWTKRSLRHSLPNQVGYEELFDWVLTFGSVKRAGIEGTGTYGAGLTRFLIKKGLDVLEINRPDRSKRRLEGKSDPLDAENAVRTVLSGSAKAVPKLQSGACEALRIISVARRSAIKAKTQAINQLRALLVSAPRISATCCGNQNRTNASLRVCVLNLLRNHHYSWHFVAHFEAWLNGGRPSRKNSRNWMSYWII
ncbi:hypothetical protein BV494_24815 (plasmid) [Rahnella sikkimica]|uniref:Transposase IS110-like N-terminal domain-containing protein n=1 Tax=Rahnella sikkimica TaxID=1805933 RepID=A0A2L1UYU8_9GAMM|nr:hypothetical protein BV494_24815 [Rahnella sikkimica]